MADFDVPGSLAEEYESGLKSGSLLIWVRTGDESVALVMQVFRDHGAASATVIPPEQN